MNRLIGLLVTLVVLFTLTVFAQEETGQVTAPSEIKVAHLVFGTGVENREATGVDSTFPATVGKVFCWTLITGCKTETPVKHIWYRNGEQMATVELMVKSVRWRTWSSKNVPETWIGEWRVDVTDAGGNVLKSAKFEVK